MAKGEAKGQRQKTEATAKAQAKARHDGKFFRRKKQKNKHDQRKEKRRHRSPENNNYQYQPPKKMARRITTNSKIVQIIKSFVKIIFRHKVTRQYQDRTSKMNHTKTLALAPFPARVLLPVL